MTKWQVVYSEQAELDLRSIYKVSCLFSVKPEVAKKQTKRIMDRIAKLNQMPLRYHLYEKEPWQSKGLRVLPVDNYLVFYVPVESQITVAVVRIMYCGRNIEEQLNRTDVDN